MELEAPGIVVDRAVHGEGDFVATLLTPDGLRRGLAKGGASRRQTGIWEIGNIVASRWTARLPEQLGAYSAELVRPAAALAMDDAQSLGILRAACQLAVQGLPEREPAPAVFEGLLKLLAGIDIPGFALAELCRWELVLLRELGFGLEAEIWVGAELAPTVNVPEEAELAVAAAMAAGLNVRRDMEPTMGAEDFGRFLADIPGAYAWIGNGPSAGLHNPGYDYNDEILPVAARFLAACAKAALR